MFSVEINGSSLELCLAVHLPSGKNRDVDASEKFEKFGADLFSSSKCKDLVVDK
jgi:hypothetical protein